MATYELLRPEAARRSFAALLRIAGTLLWAHALASLVRLLVESGLGDLAPTSVWLTLASLATALASGFATRSIGGAIALVALVVAIARGAFAVLMPTSLAPALVLLVLGVGLAAGARRIVRRTTPEFDDSTSTALLSTPA